MEERPLAPEGSLGSKKVLLVVAGGIAAYKVAQVARDLTELGADVKVLMTHSAERFVGRQTFASLTRNPVATDLWDASGEVPHVELARGADLVIVAPATANILAEMAAGSAGDLVTTTLLMARCPILAVPAMHTEMWEHPATEENVGRLQARGVRFLGPGRGSLSSGDEGPGRMVEPAEIVDEARRLLLTSQDLAGRHVLITAGGTQEPIDPVRYIGNHSSGRMGYVLADAALRRGAKVTLVSGPSELTPPAGVDLVHVRTASEMRAAVVSRSVSADVVVKAAAVADFTPKSAAAAKIKKDAGPPDIDLVPTVDILAELGSSPDLRKEGGVLVGFAAETEADPSRLADFAEAKRAAKGADMVVANEVGVPHSGFSVHTNRAVIAGPDGTEDLGLVTKEALATCLLDRVVALLK
ncbi:MAG: phosphopantothenoylcysteine decarboxylase / phosphopantothenate---cysteine ligase [Actinomycetota bacterium]|jgi:phosphopantothenoylcysteine decarboxylase/phosphopantothenate--cysteine ligase|nr:phosphopantothenoylcysteine decarboxylase / phosphopantothenate---cysteine ligase [Actinomycetota bacterium]